MSVIRLCDSRLCISRVSLSPYPHLLPFAERAYSPSLSVPLDARGSSTISHLLSKPPLLRRAAVSHCRLSLLFHIASGVTPPRGRRYVNAGRGKLKVSPRNVASATFQSLRKLRVLVIPVGVSITLISRHFEARKSQERDTGTFMMTVIRQLK